MTHFGSGGDFRLPHLMITLHAKDRGWWPNLLSWWGHKMMSAWSGGAERIRTSITGLIPAVRRIRSLRWRYQLLTSTDLIYLIAQHRSYTISPSFSCCLFNSLSALSSFMLLCLCDLPPLPPSPVPHRFTSFSTGGFWTFWRHSIANHPLLHPTSSLLHPLVLCIFE